MKNQEKDFATLMQKACELKEEQVKQDRKYWESKPKHIRHTIFHDRCHLNLPDLKVKKRLEIASAIKTKANHKFYENDFYTALDLYEKALGCFTYFSTTQTDWRSNGIKDDQLTLHDYDSDDVQVQKFKAECLNNIAACYLKFPKEVADFQECILVCTLTLELNSFPGDSSLKAKALYRRAKARLQTKSARLSALDLAEKDLKQAISLDPGQNINQLLRKVRLAQIKRKSSEKQAYFGVFNSNTFDLDYESKTEKQELHRSIDWANPSNEIIQDAKNHGIDLTDPIIRREFVKMSNASDAGSDDLGLDEMSEEGPVKTSIWAYALIFVFISTIYQLLYY
mmetsp:Transcript_11636/g.13478  ORF Transcript_11636/g.13478 Transcript_11636/m.13478 type:complete len:339 (+) Transcript_11636:204-1220(+)